MRFFAFLFVLAAFSIGGSAQSYATAKPWVWGWWPGHWQNLDFKPYLGDQKIRQRSLWDGDTWTPEAWIKDAGDEKRIMRDLYAVGIIVDQYTDGDDIPVLEVGDTFIQLSGLDQRRILRFVDHVFEITKAEENGMFYVHYKDSDDNVLEEIFDGEPVLGVYTKHGFHSN